MCQFIETIRASHGTIAPLKYHQQRIDATLTHIDAKASIQLEQALSTIPIPHHPITKIRVIYDADEIISIACEPYSIRSINTLALRHVDDASYSFKYLDRKWLTALCDDVDADDIIIVKNSLITDASYANLALRKEKTWYTPSTPLLKGTRRAALIEEGLLEEISIDVEQLSSFQEIKLINAMMEWEESPVLPITALKR